MITTHPSILENRATTGRFDPSFEIDEATIVELIRLATQAPSAFHLQNWTFTAVHTREAKEHLMAQAFGQRQVFDAAVTYIVCGTLEAYRELAARLQPSVDAGIVSPAIQRAWAEMASNSHEGNPQLQRDEAIRSASLAAMALLVAAREVGLDAGVVGGFDPEGIARAFNLSPLEIPVMLVTVGRAAEESWPQKPRRPMQEVLRIR